MYLLCNVIVVTGGTAYFAGGGDAARALALPFVAGALPAAYLTGALEVGTGTFSGAVALCLGVAGAHDRTPQHVSAAPLLLNLLWR
ncbi:MAG: hypothetical protein R6W89_02255 [Candidatus Hydrogenedentota bacterium]